MFRYYLLLVLSFCLVCLGCKKSSNGNTATTSTGYSFVVGNSLYAGAATSFKSNNSRLSEKWDFGDGEMRTLPLGTGSGSVGEIYHSYKAPGVYQVTLVVNGNETNKITQSVAIEPDYNFIYAGIYEDFFYSGTTVVGDTLFFRFPAFLPQSGNSYYWAFGDGSSSVDSTPFHIYDHEGKFTVQLTVTNSAGESKVSKQVQVYKDPLYTQQLARIRTWAGVEHTYHIFDTSKYNVYVTLPDSNFSLIYSNKLSIAYDTWSFYYDPLLSSDSILVFSPPKNYAMEGAIYYYHVKDSAAITAALPRWLDANTPSGMRETKWHTK